MQRTRNALPRELPGDRGQVVGISGVCDQAAGRRSAISSVLWENGEPIEIGDLGGVAWNTPMAINQRGDVVGFANASADDGSDFNPRAFLWIRGKPVRNLGMLDGDDDSQATGINARRQVVGTSCGTGGCRAFLWQNGAMQDLNALVSVPDGMVLTVANDIDDLGRISGQAFDAATSGTRAFVAAPYLAIRR
ncbi:hypothetical protein [Luteimonas salinilitoris]|uniref:DUF3466 family protein n=1 Tax=Luteimonas salinilitoris TaxID=3237697 RepID=A0ABV4HV53_9GAMM